MHCHAHACNPTPTGIGDGNDYDEYEDNDNGERDGKDHKFKLKGLTPPLKSTSVFAPGQAIPAKPIWQFDLQLHPSSGYFRMHYTLHLNAVEYITSQQP